MPSPSPDRRRFERLVFPHLDRLVAFARRLGASEADAQDWAQETVVRAWRALSQLEDEGSVRGWLFRILRTVAADEVRTRARRHALVDVIELEARHEDAVASDYRQVSQQVLPPACGGEGRPDLPIPGAPLRAPDVRPVSCWRTTLQGEAVSAWAYRWGNRVVLAYVVPEALFFRQPRVRDAVASQGRYTASDGDASVIAWAAERSGVLVVGDAPVSELGRLAL